MFTVILLVIISISLSPAALEEISSTTTTTTTAATPVHAEQDEIADTINEFGHQLMLKLMKTNPDKNVVLSPTGVAGLLAMTLLGTVGNTYDELASVLGFSQDILTNRKNHEEFGQLLQQLSSNESSSTRTLYTDAIFVDAHAQIRQVYRDYLQRVYLGEVLGTDFKDSAKSTEFVNEWVKNHTNGIIDNFLKQPLSPMTKVVLLSALYFRGQWEHPFLVELTRQMAFKKPSSEVVADFMVTTGSFSYRHEIEQGFHIVALPYNDSETIMYALIPLGRKKDQQLSLAELMNNLNYSKINDIINKMNMSNCVIRFPKMVLNSEVNLQESLKDMGVKSIFSTVDANFALMIENHMKGNDTEDELISRINDNSGVEASSSSELKEQLNKLPNPGVFVDSVLHNVLITINEFGTEAVAVSSAFVSRSAHLFYADSPFYMFIRNERTKLITFSGVIYDPTEV